MSVYDFVTEGTPQDIVERYARLKDIAELSDFGVLDRDLVILDTETTGLSYNHDELTQIAAARLECGEITEWFVTFVNPGKPIPDDVARLTNIHDEDVADAPLPDEARAQLSAFVRDATIVAHNADFDCTFVTKSASGYCLKENLWIDSLDLSRIALPRMKSHRLIDLVHAFDAPLSTHRADADVEALCAVYRILLAAIQEMPLELVEYIANLATLQEWPTGAVFGLMAKHMKALEESRHGATMLEKHYPMTVRGLRYKRFMAGAAQDDWQGQQKPAWATKQGAHDDAQYAADDAHNDEPIEVNAYLTQQAQSVVAAAESLGLDPAVVAAEEPSAATHAAQRTMEPYVYTAPSELLDANVKVLEFPSKAEIDQAFSAQGIVGSLYDGFEPREEQLIMAQEVLKAYATSTNLAVEAGTGVGKSMAYLLPSALIALRNNVPLGVATKTNALLDQIMYKELPLLRQGLADANMGNLQYVALKGFSHYPCLRLIDNLSREGAHTANVSGRDMSQAPAIAALLSFVEQTEYDDMDTLKLDYRTLPRYAFSTTSRECLRRKCPYYSTNCFVHGVRRKAESADIVVTNHALFFCDLAADGGLLPDIRRWVVDEAHGAEQEARRALAVTLDATEMLRLANKLAAEDAKRNPFVRTERRAPLDSGTQPEASTLFFGLTEKARARGKVFAEAATALAHHMKDLVKCDKSHNKGYDTIDLWINDDVRSHAAFKALQGYGKTFREEADRLISASNELIAFLDGVDGVADCQREIATVVIDAKEMRQACELILDTASPTYVYSAKLSKKPDRVAETLEAMIVDIGETLNETLYARTESVVFASATLTINDEFTTFKQALGLGAAEQSRTNTCQLGSSYDFDENMKVLVIKDIAEPMQSGYLGDLERLLVGAHVAQRGSMLTLFTNRREMETCFDAVNEELKAHDLRLICQKWGVSVKGLRDDFLTDEHLSLFALKSFWEGFDAPGATLRGVIIPKLPFAKPTDPLSCERALRDSAAWQHYTLPQAVLEVKQAAGRLIRSHTDSGVLILADRRLITKGYGKVFLRSLPSKNVRVCTMNEAFEVLEEESRCHQG